MQARGRYLAPVHRHSRPAAAYKITAKACRKHGKTLGIGVLFGDTDLETELVRMGGRFLITGSDASYMMKAAQTNLAVEGHVSLMSGAPHAVQVQVPSFC
jgi:2-keto-3-deoxy-L-rhamnonate aldolase RhmA